MESTASLRPSACFKKGNNSQFVALQRGVMQQVKAAVVLLGEINVGYNGENLNDAPEVFSYGIM